MANSNATLQASKNLKDDEFYTTYECIEKELEHYIDHFENKTVLCNRDDPFESNFCAYFLKNFKRRGRGVSRQECCYFRKKQNCRKTYGGSSFKRKYECNYPS